MEEISSTSIENIKNNYHINKNIHKIFKTLVNETIPRTPDLLKKFLENIIAFYRESLAQDTEFKTDQSFETTLEIYSTQLSIELKWLAQKSPDTFKRLYNQFFRDMQLEAFGHTALALTDIDIDLVVRDIGLHVNNTSVSIAGISIRNLQLIIAIFLTELKSVNSDKESFSANPKQQNNNTKLAIFNVLKKLVTSEIKFYPDKTIKQKIVDIDNQFSQIILLANTHISFIQELADAAEKYYTKEDTNFVGQHIAASIQNDQRGTMLAYEFAHGINPLLYKRPEETNAEFMQRDELKPFSQIILLRDVEFLYLYNVPNRATIPWKIQQFENLTKELAIAKLADYLAVILNKANVWIEPHPQSGFNFLNKITNIFYELMSATQGIIPSLLENLQRKALQLDNLFFKRDSKQKELYKKHYDRLMIELEGLAQDAKKIEGESRIFDANIKLTYSNKKDSELTDMVLKSIDDANSSIVILRKKISESIITLGLNFSASNLKLDFIVALQEFIAKTLESFEQLRKMIENADRLYKDLDNDLSIELFEKQPLLSSLLPSSSPLHASQKSLRKSADDIVTKEQLETQTFGDIRSRSGSYPK